MDTFETAYARVRCKYTASEWLELTPKHLAAELYQEMRAIDAERAKQNGCTDKPPHLGQSNRL